MEGLTFRKATPDDTERIAEIMFSDPPQEAVRVCESVERARAFCYGQVRMPEVGVGWDRTVFGVLDSEPVVVLQAGSQLGSFRITPRLIWHTLRVLGPIRTIRSLPYITAQRRVNPEAPDDSYHIAELHTDPGYRNRGLGGATLDYAEQRARKDGHRQMSLVTTTINPARRLYERHGYRVIETRTDPAYERYTGIAGRHLMVKELT